MAERGNGCPIAFCFGIGETFAHVTTLDWLLLDHDLPKSQAFFALIPTSLAVMMWLLPE